MTLKPDNECDHNYSQPPSKKPPNEENIFWSDFLITENKEYFEIDPQYADDINWITTNRNL